MSLRRDALDELRGKGPDAEVKRTDATSLYGVPLLRGGIFAAAKMRRTTNQSIVTATDTIVGFDVKVYDNWDSETQGSEKILDLSANKIEIRRAGIYQVSAHVAWDGDNSGDYRQASIRKNGAFLTRNQTWVGTGSANSRPTNEINEPIALVRGDDITLLVKHNRGINLNIVAEGESPYLAVTWIALP